MKEYTEHSTSGTTGNHQAGDAVQLVTIERLRTFPKEVQDWYVENVPEELLGGWTTIDSIYRSWPGAEPCYLLACFNDTDVYGLNTCPFFDEDFMPPPGLLPRKDCTLPMI